MSKKLGVYICECGPNIPDRIDIDRIIDEITNMEDTDVVKRFNLLCSNDGKQFLADEIKKEELTHVVIAACSPREHEATFMHVLEDNGLNPYLLQMVNIREQCAWMISDKNRATHKAIRSIRAGIQRVILHDALAKKMIDSTPDVLVIGGGISGIESALSLAGPNRRVTIVEKMDYIGGFLNKTSGLLPHQGTDLSLFEKKKQSVLNHEHIEVLVSSRVSEIRGYLGNFEVTVEKNDGSRFKELRVGAIVVASGFASFDPGGLPRFRYGEVDNVFSAHEFEQMCQSGNILLKNGSPPQSVAIIHCVGRAEKGYCSKVCCLYSLKFAHLLKDRFPEIEVREYYQDLCLPHPDDQAYYEQAVEKGVLFIRNDQVELKEDNGKIMIFSGNHKNETASVDMAVLSPAVVPSKDTPELAAMLNIPLDRFGFFKEVHEMLDPVASPVEGVYVVGCGSGPKNVPESIVQAQAAAGKILCSLIPGKKLEPEVKVSFVKEEFCTGCQTCLSVCYYSAIVFDEMKGVAVVNEAICRGCGSCVGSCPSGAIRSKHFTYPQIYREILEALR